MYVDCSENELTSIDMSLNHSAVTVTCSENRLTSLKVGAFADLRHLDCSANQLSGEALNDMFDTLHDIPAGKRNSASPGLRERTLLVADNPGTKDCNATVAVEKGWILRRH